MRFQRLFGTAGACALAGMLLHAGATNPPTTRPARVEWGLYFLDWSRDYEQRLGRHLARFASRPDYVMFFMDLCLPYPRARVDAVYANGAVPLISLELYCWHGGRYRTSHLPAINAGGFDDFLRRWARDAAADGRRILLRFGYEFNGDWFSYGGDPRGFVRAWRRAHDIFVQAGADNVEWVWSPNVMSVPDTPANSMHRYYPGDSYVDWVALDGYNFGDGYDRWHRWQSFEEVFGKAFRDLARRYPDKPVMISEFGCAPGRAGRRAAWIRQAYRTLRRYRQVRAVLWFDHDKRHEGEPDWRLSDADGSLAAFNATFARPP